MIPITKVRCGPEEEALVLEVLRSGMLAQGPMVERFEACCREMTGARHAVAVTNGTIALAVALEAIQLQPGDEVVTSPFTFVATLNSILETGATVRFADIADDDFGLDGRLLADVLTPRTRAVMPVHLYGQAAEMAPIVDAARAHGAWIVEDAAQAHGATYHGRPVGTFGLATFSFYATKNLHAGEGGVVTTDDDVVAERVRVLRNQGMRNRYEYVVPGHNYRMSDLAAAVAIPQFDRIQAIVTARRANAAHLNEQLDGIAGIVTPVVDADRGHVWHQYTLRVTDESPITRDELVRRLADRGVGCGIYYPRAVYDYECFREHPRVQLDGGCPIAERVAGEVVSLPVHQHLTDDERKQIVAAVHQAMN